MSGSLKAACHLAAGRAVALPEPRREDRGCQAPDSLQTETVSLKAVARGWEADPWGMCSRKHCRWQMAGRPGGTGATGIWNDFLFVEKKEWGKFS